MVADSGERRRKRTNGGVVSHIETRERETKKCKKKGEKRKRKRKENSQLPLDVLVQTGPKYIQVI